MCAPPGESACDPRSNDGCDSEQACDLNGNEALVCFDPPNEQDLYDYCDNDDGPFCSGGLHCYQGSCLRFCCDSSDCDGAECEPLYPGSATSGVCLD